MHTPLSPESYATLTAHIRRFMPFSAEENEQMGAYLRVKELIKKDFLLQDGQICPADFFLVQGCVRKYFLDAKGVEQTIQFGIENWWMSDYHSLDTGKPSPFSIQALEDTVVLCLDRSEREELFAQLPRLERYFRILLQKTVAADHYRIQFLFTLTGRERYRHFSESFPAFVQRIPQYMLASYLGFTPEFLSKIRAERVS